MNSAQIILHPDQKGPAISPSMYGIFYEDINHAGDGGLYAELVRNRGFMDARVPEGTWYYGGQFRTRQRFTHPFSLEDPLPGWQSENLGEARSHISPKIHSPRNPRVPNQLHWTVLHADQGRASIINQGFWGMALRPVTYHLTLIVRSPQIASIQAELIDPSGAIVASAACSGIRPDWCKLCISLPVHECVTGCVLRFTASEDGEIDFDYVSLLPEDAHRGVFDPQLFQMLADLHPAFLRFPGGCIVEGMCLENAWNFEPTLGAPEDRPGCWNLWNYRRTDGLGFHEFLQLCEDLSADAMYVVNCGMSCQNRNSESASPEQTEMFLQRAIDAIEYAIAPVDTPLGKRRAEAGHPDPFPLKYLEIGNENYGPEYVRRYHEFYTHLKARFPELIYLATDRTGLNPSEIDMMDDHYYMAPEYFASLYHRYDKEPRGQYTIYVGEYACKTDVGIGNLTSAISDAIFLMGCENNGDVVKMTSYAPLFCHQKDRRWSVNLICFEDGKCFGIPTYHLLKLFAQYRPDYMIATETMTESFTGEAHVFCNAGMKGDQLIVKIVNFSQDPSAIRLNLGDYQVKDAYTMSHRDARAENSIEHPDNVCVRPLSLPSDTLTLPPYSFAMLICESTKK